MVIHVSELNNTELKQVLKCVPIKVIRQPILDDQKLAKKYIVGFRPANVTHIQLFPLYSNEIHYGNKGIIQNLKNAILQFFFEKDLKEGLESLDENTEWMNCANFGYALGKCNCEISFALIKKICGLEIDDDKCAFVENLAKLVANETSKKNEESELASGNLQKIESEREKLKKELDNLQKKLQKAKKEKEDVVSALADQEQAFNECKSELSKTVTQLRECQSEKEKSDRLAMESESTISSLNGKIHELDEKVNILIQEKKDILRTVEEVKSQSLQEYEEIIVRLVSETIGDIKDDYDIDKEQFDDIVEELGGDCTITEIWGKISKINGEIVADIEAAMQSRKVDLSIIDQCNDVENNILVKYVMVKAIKSLYYEIASKEEKKRKLGDLKKR